jgi:arylsulfatase A-like enzyme
MCAAQDLDFDYKQDRKLIMPNLDRALSKGGIEFRNHVAVVSVCGPSRSSLLAGRFPHNTGYVANARAASMAAWGVLQDETLGTWMTKSGYYTAFLGKYINGMECTVPNGWRHWGGLTCANIKRNVSADGAQRLEEEHHPVGGTYNFYNASQWHVDFEKDGETRRNLKSVSEGAPDTVCHDPALPCNDDYRVHTNTHQATFLGNQTVEQARQAVAAQQPFFVHTTPVMVHVGSCYGPLPSLADYPFDDPHRESRLVDPVDGTNKSVVSSVRSQGNNLVL